MSCRCCDWMQERVGWLAEELQEYLTCMPFHDDEIPDLVGYELMGLSPNVSLAMFLKKDRGDA